PDAQRSPEPTQPAATAAIAEPTSVDPALPEPTHEGAPSRPTSVDPAAPESARSPPASGSSAATAGAPADAQRGLNLSAEGAARSLLASEAGTWRVQTSQRAELDAREREARAEELRLAQHIMGLSRHSEDRGITPLAQDSITVLLRPWKLITEPLRSARYHYRGLGFDAIIQADGGVRFRNKNGVSLAFIPVMLVTGQSAATFGIALGRELFSPRKGRDPHASERRTFLDRTRELRMHLYQHTLRAALARADRQLTQTLADLEVQLERGNDRNARAALFKLWDECSEDELGAAARKRVEHFVREHCVPGTAVGYEAEELAALNARRASKAPFEPFAAVAEPDSDAAAGIDAPSP
ncbi:MAG TPA: hypothetical protein VJU61_11810, partial [Polyangiaceae bacterium]|nr:hypothetical protein [Polyangiaceae bacterium]